MKVTKSQLKELIKQAIVEESDIMDKDMENPKTGNTIKVRTALQLPDDHPANKKAKEMVSKSSPTKDDKPTAATPAPKGKSKGPTKNPFSKESPAYDTFDSEKPDDEPSDDSGGPSYADVPKGAKTSKQVKLIKKNDKLAKQINPNVSDSIDLVMNGMSDDIDEFMNEIPDMGQDFEKADELLNLVRDNEQGMRDDDDDVIEDYKKGILKALNTPGKGGSGKSGKDIDKQAMSAADAANAKMDKDEKVNKAKEYLKDLQKALKNAEPGSAFASMYKDNIKTAKKTLKKLQSESIKEAAGAIARGVGRAAYKGAAMAGVAAKKAIDKSKDKEKEEESVKKRRFTVKEVRMWMKKLEENRYKRVYNSDARRVAWMVNNEGRTLDEMPMSMKKKWTKAQYGRERYLAKEFLKSKSEQLSEAITGADRKTLLIFVREIVQNLKKAGAKKPSKVIGRGVLSIMRAMTYTPDNANYKQYKKYFPKKYNSKLVQKHLKNFHNQNDKVQVTLVQQAMNNVLGEGILREQIRESIRQKLNEKSFGDVRKIKFDKKDGKKIVNIITSKKYKLTKPLFKTKGKDIELHIPKKEYNKAIEFFMKNKINPRG